MERLLARSGSGSQGLEQLIGTRSRSSLPFHISLLDLTPSSVCDDDLAQDATPFSARQHSHLRAPQPRWPLGFEIIEVSETTSTSEYSSLTAVNSHQLARAWLWLRRGKPSAELLRCENSAERLFCHREKTATCVSGKTGEGADRLGRKIQSFEKIICKALAHSVIFDSNLLHQGT